MKIGDIKYQNESKPRKCEMSIWAICPMCGVGRWSFYYHQLKRPNILCLSCVARENAKMRNKKMSREKHPNWKGGRNKDRYGYINVLIEKDNPYFTMANKERRIREHRLIVAQYLGRCLTKIEQVHHLNGVRDDNRVENLGIVSINNHQHNTLIKLLQTRIRKLETQILQRRMGI